MWLKVKRHSEKILKADEVFCCAMKRISEIFSVPLDFIRSDSRFGYELDCTFMSDFRLNELDKVLNDIRDVATKEILQEIESGDLVINTVKDYCDYMLRCSIVNAGEVAYVLKIPK